MFRVPLTVIFVKLDVPDDAVTFPVTSPITAPVCVPAEFPVRFPVTLPESAPEKFVVAVTSVPVMACADEPPITVPSTVPPFMSIVVPTTMLPVVVRLLEFREPPIDILPTAAIPPCRYKS
jgi:hypothetical protein